MLDRKNLHDNDNDDDYVDDDDDDNDNNNIFKKELIKNVPVIFDSCHQKMDDSL